MSVAHARAPGLRLFSVGLVCLAVHVIVGLIGGISDAFVAPRAAGSRQSLIASRASGSADQAAKVVSDALDQNNDEYLKALQDASLEACIVADEDHPEDVEKCSELAYELAEAEQLMLKRQDSIAYLDSDSY
uniref:Uncharacterized protein n=1 Tax=Alexandrium catenella TaxID=2925 RepID=A0A7S1MFU6_ALECA|mmetsp:Transcript_25943/g.70580  ORF Transcript_25943/g.70580 Transcript_25943/m.70580 type:complete len:132 (+) Transcript_25943:106-501(+)|eukprot:CAMPEP_0171197192 /NCGR_PEP_ID=MMETSP0790-20130122/22287_1 /TAXON_ID=2925 /ORGANISM="Alexandrium catenella, Strain OF101" /LENGTH=131 /DNA_ID=CAMNT_0011662431 /DNA_START=95 /DNA_END=490 /DNA_ORIENTATION=+